LIYERLLNPFLSVEAGLGFLGISAGAKVYFPSIRPGTLRFHTGVTESYGGDLWNGVEPRTYIPLGINMLTKNNIWLSADVVVVVVEFFESHSGKFCPEWKNCRTKLSIRKVETN